MNLNELPLIDLSNGLLLLSESISLYNRPLDEDGEDAKCSNIEEFAIKS